MIGPFGCIISRKKVRLTMPVERIISYASVAIVTFVGIMILSGYIGALDTNLRVGFGLAILSYAGIRLAMIYRAGKQERERP